MPGCRLRVLLTVILAAAVAFPLVAAQPVRLVITGNLTGAVKDCRCPHGQPGGLARRKAIFDRIRKQTPEAVFIDCGRVTDDRMVAEGDGELELLEELIVALGYDVVCPYVADFCAIRGLSDVFIPDTCGLMPPYSMSNIHDIFAVGPDPFGSGHQPYVTSVSHRLMAMVTRAPLFNRSGVQILIVTMSAMSDNYSADVLDTAIAGRIRTPGESVMLRGMRLAEPEREVALPLMPHTGYSLVDRFIIAAGNTLLRCLPPTLIYWWDDYLLRFPIDVNTFPGLTVLVKNLQGDEAEWKPGVWTGMGWTGADSTGLDLLIMGGGGFVEAEVKQEDGFLIAYPGIYGGYVLVVDLWSEDGRSVSRFDWEAIPTETALPDSTFEAIIDDFHKEGSSGGHRPR